MMKAPAILGLTVIATITACGSSNESEVTGVMQGRTDAVEIDNEPDDSLALTAPEKLNLMTYRGGEVLRTPIKTQAIFWGSEWSTPKYAGDKVDGINRLLSGIGNSAYLNIVGEYGATASVKHTGNSFDTSIFPTGDLTPGQAAAEVCKVTQKNPDSTTVYFIYGTKKAKANICATHGWGNCPNGKKFLMAWFPDIDEQKCMTPDFKTKNTQALKNLANATAHELAEILTDPRRGGWFDTGRDEIADKCAWTFPADNITLTNGSSFRLINLWSNKAYDAGKGMANGKRLRGCVDRPFK